MKYLKRYFSILLIAYIIEIGFCQTSKTFIIGQTLKGKIDQDESREFFTVTISKSEANKILIFDTHQDKESNKTEIEFSDPDIFISKINQFPSSKRSSEWYSETFGSDVLTIPPNSVKENDKFYVGLYCEKKCKYSLKVYTSEESEIDFLEIYNLNLAAHESISYKLHIDEDFQNLKVIAYSQMSGKFRLFMSKTNPSSQNTFDPVPSWKNGYYIEVQNSEKEKYCKNCDYHILIQNVGNTTINSLLLYSYIDTDIFELYPNVILHDAMSAFSKRCYKFNILQEEKLTEKLIIQTNIYSGESILSIEGWKIKDNNERKEFIDDNYIYQIIGSDYVILSKIDFNEFDQEYPEFKGKDSTLHFCFYSHHETSFTISTYFLSKLEKIQESNGANTLVPGQQIRNYLLKDQIIKYELFGLDVEKAKFNIKTNFTVETITVAGELASYGYFCKDEECIIKNTDIEKLKNENKLIESKEDDFQTTYIDIDYNENTCFKNPLNKLENGNTVQCSILILIKCINPNENGLCVYDLELDVENVPLLMQPKEIYYGIIPLKKDDKYEILITDPNIHSIVVVLDTESGDAELLFFKIDENIFGEQEETLVKGSFKNSYIPEVIRITPANIKKENLLGKYLIKVISSKFTSYHIYYYPIYNISQENSTKLPEVTMKLEIGEVITDYFPNDIRYKIFTYYNLLDKKSDIKIFINKVNIDFDIYVFSNLTNFAMLKFADISKDNSKEPIYGYDWKSNGTNEIHISKDDKKYELNKLYYIVLVPNLSKPPDKKNLTKGAEVETDLEIPPERYYQLDMIDKKSAIKFYLGVSEEKIPITISEGIPHSFSLNDKYNGQKYFYTHTDIYKDFDLHINVFVGEIDVYVDIKEIDITKLPNRKGENEKISETMIYILGIDEDDLITIESKYFRKYFSSNEDDIHLYFYIRRSEYSIKENSICQYMIIEKSSESKGEILQPGEIRTSELRSFKKDYYIIEEVQKRDGGIINVNFQNGIGNLYVRIPATPESDNIRFPDSGLYDFFGETVYSGKIVQIPEEVYKTLDSRNIKIQILVTVEALSGTDEGIPDFSLSSEATYTISYSNEPKRINQNSPYDGFIEQGELQYYSFYFDDTTQNIYIGLSNMNGDADIYLNYGTSLPTPTVNNWDSTESTGHEYIDFNIEDDFFKKNNISSLAGFYTLLLIGYTDTSFTLFVSNHKDKVIPLRNNKPMTCICERAWNKCFFRYNDVFEIDNSKKGIKNNEIIFTTQYLYGNGIMYSKVSKDSELHENDFYKYFPTESDYEMSTKESKQRNYMKMKVQGDKYTEDSTILLTFICSERTQVDVTSTVLRHFKSVDFMAENRENIYYLGFNDNNSEQPELDIYFYNMHRDQDFIYSFHSYVGNAHVKVYSNDSHWDVKKQTDVYDYHIFKEFEITSKSDDDKENIEVYYPYSKDYHNYISKEDKKKYNSVIFRITPKSEFGFYIQGNFDKNWYYLPIGKIKKYLARNNQLFGYFDINEAYSDMEFSLKIDNNLEMSADVYLKINIIDTKKKMQIKNNQTINEFQLYQYSFPSYKNYDYHEKTDRTLGTISIDINKLPSLSEKEQEYKFIRVLFMVNINKEEFDPLHDIEEEEDERRDIEINENIFGEEQLISILITPGVKHFKYIEANPRQYYFSNLTYDKNKQKKIPETKIYTLTKENLDHDLMVIEISSCNGHYEIRLLDQLITKEMTESTVEYEEYKENGKHSIYIKNLKSKHIYLAIKAKLHNIICSIISPDIKGPKKCGNDLSYLMYYYTIKKENLEISEKNKLLFYRPYGKGKVKIDFPEIILRDINNNKKNLSDYHFDVFATKDSTYFDRMGSICYLSRFLTKDSSLFNLENIKVEKKNGLVISELGYRTRYFINILVQNKKTKELLAFKPIVIWSGGFLPFALWKTFTANIVIVILVVLLIIFITKYKSAKTELREIKGDTLPKTESEISNSQQRNDVKYSGLGESY